ncbi:MAG: MarR family transcriptional regulator [Sphaerochaetaceae bacterium]|nr:MarR family transcriptional regulator [Sphaerochaetaceae bacterium]
MNLMKLSQPNSARIINTARVLSALRGSENLSKAELARILTLNKVSTGEIVDSLLERGLVRETGKLESSNGRRATSLQLVDDSAYVLAVHYGLAYTQTALCTLTGNVLKIERLPSSSESHEAFCALVIKSLIRASKLAGMDKVYGVGLSCDTENISSGRAKELKEAIEKYLKKEVALSETAGALICAEKAGGVDLSGDDMILYLNWGERIELSIFSRGNVAGTSAGFGQILVSSEGNLESFCSVGAIRGEEEAHMKDLWPKVDSKALSMMAKALRTASRVTGSNRVIVGGEGATIDEDHLDVLNSLCPGMKIEASGLGEKALLRSAGELALDHFFYMNSLIDGVKDWI